MKTVHLIFNAHLDPVWLWPWQSSLDEMLATCRSACDRLDTHPDLYFSRGEAWVYEQIERMDPKLFVRMAEHVRSGRWEIVGGWWIQPDCNLPSGLGMQRQIRLGKQYFENRFGQFPRVGYNVDSFGHAASLPGLMREAGQDCYVMMRPQEHEMALPARLFRWQGYQDGPEVTTFRIARGYCTGRELTEEHIWTSLTELPEGIDDTMCFVGIGDHGGGPTESQIAWCREHENAFEGCRLVFSTPSRFFEAVSSQADRLPVVTGELQHHAIGCYSVYRPVKVGVLNAEHLLRQAEVLDPEADLTEAWKRVCFHQFHDTLGGTCLPSAYPQVLAHLGSAVTAADESIQISMRRQITSLPDDTLQRIVTFNASDAPFAGYLEFEPWLDWRQWEPEWRLLDEQGSPLPLQILHSEALLHSMPRLLFPAEIPPASWRVFRIEPKNGSPESTRVFASPEEIRTVSGLAYTSDGLVFPSVAPLSIPTLEMLDDPSDTWSHGIDRYSSEIAASAIWDPAVVVDSGPLMASLIQIGAIGNSQLRAEWRVYSGSEFLDLHLEVFWHEVHKLLKLSWPFAEQAPVRIDGILGGHLPRVNDGRELPLRDWTLSETNGGIRQGILCPDVFAADGTHNRIRLTLLRSSVMAHHEPHSGVSPRRVISDQGHHTFRFQFAAGTALTAEILEQQSLTLRRPPILADLTRGMKPDTRR